MSDRDLRSQIEGLFSELEELVTEVREDKPTFLEKAAELSADGVAVTDMEGNIQFVNPAWARMHGYDVNELLGQHQSLFHTEEQMQRDVIPFNERVMETGVQQGEIGHVRKDGATFPAWTETILVKDENGEPLGLVSTARDITEQKQAEEDLLRLRSAVEQTGDGIAIADLEGNILFANPAWAQMHGYEVEEIVGQHLSIFHTEEQLQEEVIPFNQRMMEVGVNRGEVGHVRKDGTTFPTLMTGTVVKDEEGKPVMLVGTARDITERKQLEQAIQESLDQRDRQVQVSTEVAQEIAAASSLDELYRRVVTLIKERFGYYHVQIFRHDPEQNAMVVVEGYGRIGRKMKAAGYSLPYGKGIVGTAAATGESVLAPDVSRALHWVPHPDLPDTQGELAVPIKLRDEVLGVLDVQSDTVGTLSEEDQVMLLGLAGQIAIAIESTRLFERTQAILARTEALYDGSERVVRATTVDEVLQAMIESTALQKLDRVSIAFFNRPWEDERPEEATIIAAWERSGEVAGAPVGTQYALARLPVIEVITRDEPTIFRDIPTDEHVSDTLRAFFLDTMGVRSMVIWPLVAGGQWIGFFTGQANTALGMDEEEIRQITSLVNQAATVIQNLRLFQQMEAALKEAEATHRRYVSEQWAEFVPTRGAPSYERTRPGVPPLGDVVPPEVEQAVARQEAVVRSDTGDGAEHAALVVPISLRGTVIGALGLQEMEEGRRWTDDEVALIEAVADQMALALENARLFEQTQRRAARERLIREITARVRDYIDVETILQTTVQEVGKALGTSHGLVRLGTEVDWESSRRGTPAGE